jgi:hypothetical protein
VHPLKNIKNTYYRTCSRTKDLLVSSLAQQQQQRSIPAAAAAAAVKVYSNRCAYLLFALLSHFRKRLKLDL